MTPMIYFTRLSGYTFSMSVTENASYPLSNLLNYIPTIQWVSSDTSADQYLQIDFGQDVAKSFILFDNHNLYTIGNDIKVQAADNAAMSGAVTLVSSTTPTTDGVLIYTFTTDSHRYVRITFNVGAVTSAVPPAIGNLFMGVPYAFQYPHEFGQSAGQKQFDTNTSTSIGGINRASQMYAGRRRYKFTWRRVGDADAADFMIVFDACRGRLIPFYFQWNENHPIRFVKFAKDYIPFTGIHYQLSDMEQTIFEEAITGDDVSTNDQFAGQTLVFGVPLPGMT